jgi:hypothetical protein
VRRSPGEPAFGAAGGHRRASLRAAAAVLSSWLAWLPTSARAQPAPPKTPNALPVRSAAFGLEDKRVVLSVSFRDVIDAEISKKLLNGFPTVISVRGYLFRETGGDPIALTAKTCRVAYDLWDEVFRIQLAQPGIHSTTVAVNLEGVLRNCAEVRKIPLVDRSLLRDGARYFVATLVEVNPVSAETLDRIKKWVARPNATSGIGPGDSLFGSFVGLFVARIGDADRRLAFRTQPFAPPNPPPP